MSLKGTTNAEKIWNYLIEKGLTPQGAAGLMGNLDAESALIPTNLQNSYERSLGMNDVEYTAAVDSGKYANFAHDAAGYGLAQWTYWSRKQGLLAYAKASGKSVGDLEMQLGFLMKELSESFSSVLATLKTTASVRAASDSVLTKFERPADMGTTAQEKRAAFGQTYYDKYAGTKATAQPAAANSCTVERLLEIAKAEVGYHEKASNSQLDDKTANSGSGNWTKYARDLYAAGYYNGNKNGYDWCDSHFDWLFYKLAGCDAKRAQEIICQTGDLGAGCTYSMQYYKNAGRLDMNPKVGDQIFFRYSGTSGADHTGLVIAVTATSIRTHEGNSGDCVRECTYSRSDRTIVGYGHPKFDPSTPAPVPAPAPAPTTPAVELKVGDVVTFTGTTHYSNANAASGPSCKPGKAKVTNIYKSGKHPIHLIATSDGDSTVYGWVDLADITVAAKWEPAVGDIVNYTGSVHYASANATSGPSCKGGKAKIHDIYQLGKSKHPYLLIWEPGSGATVYGWVDAGTFTKA